MFTEVLFTITKIWKQPKCLSMDEWKTKMWGIHKIVFSLEKEENLANYDNMDGP